MNWEQKAFRMSVAVLIGAILLRLLGGSWNTAAAKAVPRLSQALIFLQTGRLVSLDGDIAEETPTEPSVEETTVPAPTNPPATVFSPADADLLEIRNTSGYDLDIQGLLTQPLCWDLTADGPAVLILHTHGTEGYTGTENYRSLEPSENMLAVGERLARLLTEAGIGVIHDKTMHDADSYSGSYAQARTSIEQYLAEYPSIRLVLDLHRDSIEDAQGNQLNYTVTTEKGAAAKLMLVLGSDAGGLTHPQWRENTALALKLHAQLEKNCSGICRHTSLRTSRFNQDLCPGALLVEVGAAGNTLEEALLATDILAQGIIGLAYGANSQ